MQEFNAPTTYPPLAITPSGLESATSSTVHLTSIKAGPKTSRTPSPTPSEHKALKGGVFDWKELRNWRFWIRREWLWYYVALIIILVLTALVTIYHKEIVDWLTPVSRWLHEFNFGWVVPIAVLFVISFPPLFGHEIVAILCGLVWGLWIGFGIVCAGTFIGEVGNFYAFKYCCRARGEKLERTKIPYACLAKVVREGGFKIALIARLSAIPGHFTTAVFSTCGMGIVVFSIAAILSMPKQFITVYLGVIIEQSHAGETDKKSRIISNVVLALTFLITILAMWYIFRQMDKVKPEVIYERRKARQTKLDRYANESTSEVNVSLTAVPPTDTYPFALQYQPSSRLYAPQPQHPPSNAYAFARDDVELGTSPSPQMMVSSPPLATHSRYESADQVEWDLGHKQPVYGYDLSLDVDQHRSPNQTPHPLSNSPPSKTVRMRHVHADYPPSSPEPQISPSLPPSHPFPMPPFPQGPPAAERTTTSYGTANGSISEGAPPTYHR